MTLSVNWLQRLAVCACWRRVAVARVFALVVRCRIMMLFVYSRVGKNRDTMRECPAAAGPACAAITNLSSGREVFVAQKPIAYTALLAAGHSVGKLL